jgi:hypothetical protein
MNVPASPHHTSDVDYTCRRCKLFVQAHIPHECDPRICRQCEGFKSVWLAGQGFVLCDRCQGKGMIDLRRN